MPDIFTEQERPYLSRKKKKDYLPLILVLLVLVALGLFVDIVLKWTVVHAEETVQMSDERIYQDWDTQTKELCTNYLNTH